MKKNFVRVMLFGALTLAVSTTVTSCKDYDDDIKGLQEQVDNIKSTNPVSTEDMKAAIVEATKALEKKVADMKDLVDGKVSTDDLKKKIEALEEQFAAGDQAVADDLIKAKDLLQQAIDGKATQASVNLIQEDVKKLKDMQTTLQALIDAENKFKNNNGDLSGFENTSFDKFINQSIKNALKDKGEIASYVMNAVQNGVASNGKALNDRIATYGIAGVANLTDFVDKIYYEIFKDGGAIKNQLDGLDELLNAINAYVGSGQGQLADYQAVIAEIMATRDAVTALSLPEGKTLSEAVQAIIATELGDAKTTLGKLQSELKAEIAALKGMIQSIVYVPESADRTVYFNSLKVAAESDYASGSITGTPATWYEVGNALEKKVRFRVSPASVIDELIKEDGKYEITTDAQVMTRAANVFTVGAVEKVANEPNLIEVTLKKSDAIDANVKGYVVALTVIGKDSKTEYSDVSSDYFAMMQNTLYIKTIEYAWADATKSLIKENKDDKIDYASNGAYEFIVTSNPTETSTERKSMDELGIDGSKFEVTFALGAGEDTNYELTEGVLKAKSSAGVGATCSVTPTITVTYEDGTAEITGAAYPTVTLTSKGAPVNLTFNKLKWNLDAKVYTLTADGNGTNNLKGLTDILTALSTTETPVTDLTRASSVSDPADNATKPCMVLSNNNIIIKIPAKYVTTDEAGDKVSVTLTKYNKTVTVSAVITVSATTAEELVWDWNSLNSTPGIETMLLERDNDNLSSVTLTRNLTQAYEPTVFADLNKRKDAKEIEITPTISPLLTTGSSINDDYIYTIDVENVDYTYEKAGKANPITVTFGVTSNEKSIAPADKKNVINIIVPVEELNGTLILPKKRIVETLDKSDEIELSSAFNLASGVEENEENGYNLTWKDSRDEVMWPTPATGKFAVASADAALDLYGLSIKFVPKSEVDFKKYFDLNALKNTGKVKLNAATVGQEIIGSDISAVVVLKATSKWGPVAGDGTEFTVTFKKGAK